MLRRLLSYKSIYVFLSLFVLTVALYQNCSSDPMQDLNVNEDLEQCASVRSSMSFSNVNSTYTFSVDANENVDYFDWTVSGAKNIVQNNVNSSTAFIAEFDVPGSYIIRARGYSRGCKDQVMVISDSQVTVNDSGSNCQGTTLVASPRTINVGSTSTVTFSAPASASNIKWYFNDVLNETFNNQTSAQVNPTVSGAIQVKVTFELQNCGYREITETITVNSLSGSAVLTTFDVKPYVGDGIARPGDGINKVFKMSRSSNRRLSLMYANLSGEPTTVLPTATGTNCLQGSKCYQLESVTSSGNPDVCIEQYFSVVAAGTNGTSTTSEFFAFCPQQQNYCHVGLKVNQAIQEKCSTTATSCPLNQYVPSTACTQGEEFPWCQIHTCTEVGNGYYSAAGSITRQACTNKPANSTYTGPGVSSTTTCPWACSSGYALYQGSSCSLFPTNKRPQNIVSGSTCNANNTSCTISLDVNYVANGSNVYVDLRQILGGTPQGNPITVQRANITVQPLTNNQYFGYRLTFNVTDSSVISWLRNGRLSLHVVSPDNPVNFRWNDPHHTVKTPGATGGTGPGGCIVGFCSVP